MTAMNSRVCSPQGTEVPFLSAIIQLWNQVVEDGSRNQGEIVILSTGELVERGARKGIA